MIKISIDSRTIKKGEYFVPVKGPNFNGYDFVNDALKNGAKGIIKEEQFYKIVKDKLLNAKSFIIAVAGSVGKSTFRSYLTSILKTKFDVLESDQNTKLGFSLKVANELKKQKIIVAEVGIDRIGEMKSTASFINPDLSIVTKLGKEHLQYFKTFKIVAKEESDIFNYTKTHIYYVKSEDTKYFKNTKINEKFLKDYNKPINSLIVENRISNLLLPDHEKDYLRGIYNIVTKHFSLNDEEFISGLKKLTKPKGRLNLINLKNGSILVDDTYNAVCDETIIKGIEYAQSLSEKLNKKIKVVISNMVENGMSSDIQHKNVCNFINKSGLKEIYIVGENLKYYRKYLKIKFLSYETADLIKFKKEKDVLYYIKATRRYKGPELVERLINL